MKGLRFSVVSVATIALALCAATAYGNVYPSGVSVDTATLSDTCGTAKVTYVLNEDADGDGTNPGVKIEVLDNTLAAVRTVAIARQRRGTQVFEWDGRKDDGSRALNGSYTVKITAADLGYSVWAQITTDATDRSFYTPYGVSVNKNPGSTHYGSIYVSNAVTGTTTFGRNTPEGIYRLKADGTAVNNGTAGVTWGGTSGPWKSTIGADDRLYVTDLSNDLVYDIAPDLSSAVQLITSANRTTNQWVAGVLVKGTQATGDRRIYLANSNYNDTARKGLIEYILGGNPTATSGDTGTQIIGPGFFTYYPTDVAGDSNGDWYMNQYRYDPSQASAIAKFLNATPPINTAVWQTAKASPYNGAYGLDVYEPKGWVAYSNFYDGWIRIFNMSDGSYVGGFDNGNVGRDLAFDDAGNVYVVDNNIEWLRGWSPPDGPNSKATTSAAIALNKSGSGGPVITDQPDDAIFCPNGTANLSVLATGTNLTYQWVKDGVDIPGETTANLTLSNVPASDAGAIITVRVCDDNGVVVSEPATLKVGISFIENPLSQTVCDESNPQFSVNATGVGSLSYQWQKDVPPIEGTYEDISGQTTNTLVLSNVQGTDSGTRIRCAVRDDCNPAPADPVYSAVAVLTVRTGPTITHVGYGNLALAVGGSHKMVCDATNTIGTAHFVWKKDGVVIPGVPDQSFYQITDANCTDHNGLYSCQVTDDCGSSESSTSYGGGEARIIVGGTEVCGNGRDDDCDGLTDCDDSDCDNDPNCVPPCPRPFADADGDSDVDHVDFAAFQLCVTGPDDIGGVFNADLCRCFDWDRDLDIDSDDHSKFELCASGPGVAADEGCAPYPTGNVVINEIVYDNYGVATDDKEFVELYNADTVAVDIAGWLLRSTSGRDFIIPAGPGGGPNLLAVGDFYVIGSGSILPPVDLSVSPSTDIWGNGETAIELVDGNQTVKDTVVYERFATGELTLTAPEGGVWGEFETSSALQSLSRYFDGRDTDVNGYDFGLRLQTPGASNESGSSVVTTFAVPDVDNATVGSDVAGLLGSFVNGHVIDPTLVNTDNLNAIAVSPQGGKAIIAWDPTGGGNSVHSTDLFDGAGGYDMWVYFDTTTVPDGAPGAETSIYGIMGTVGTFVYELNSFPDPEALLLGDVVTNNASTGVAWVYNRNHASQTRRLYLVNAKDGGNSRPGTAPRYWDVLATIDMSTVASGWYRLAISYSADGSVSGTFDTQTFAGTAQANLAGSFYIGYQESATAVPTWLRPPTFDLRP